MQKDLKIGLILGLAIVSVAGLWLATRPGLTPRARILDVGNAGPQTMDDGRGMMDGGRHVSRPSSIIPRPSPAASEAVSQSGSPPARVATAAVQVQPAPIKPQRFHIVRQGETLSEISYQYYGSAGKWRKIFEANRTTLKDANVVRSGTKLIIPD